MPSPSIPSGPSPEQQRIDAEFERERVKYESEKRRFLEQVASYETLSRGTMRQNASTFENVAPTTFDPAGLFIPARFTPSLQAETTTTQQANPAYSAERARFSERFGGTYNVPQFLDVTSTAWTTGSGQRLDNRQLDWYWAPNLGLRNPNA